MLGELLSAGLNFLSGQRTADAQEEANRLNAANAERNIQLQKDFAQQGIQWKIADAKAAGVAPWAALGTSTGSFSPVSIGVSPVDGVAKGMAAAGNDIGRALASTASGDTRNEMFTKSMQDLQLQGAQLDNDIKRASIASAVQRLKSAQLGPPMPATDVPIPTKKPSDINRLYVGGSPIAVDPGTSSAQDIENRYGDDISWMTAPVVGWNDMMHHFNWDGARISMPPRDYFTWDAYRKRVQNSWSYKFYSKYGKYFPF